MERVKERIKGRGRIYEQSIPIEYLFRLQERYLDHLQKLPDDRVLVVDLQDRDLLKDASAFKELLTILSGEVSKGYQVITL